MVSPGPGRPAPVPSSDATGDACLMPMTHLPETRAGFQRELQQICASFRENMAKLNKIQYITIKQ